MSFSYKLVFQIASAITTYIVVLMQFRESDNTAAPVFGDGGNTTDIFTKYE